MVFKGTLINNYRVLLQFNESDNREVVCDNICMYICMLVNLTLHTRCHIHDFEESCTYFCMGSPGVVALSLEA